MRGRTWLYEFCFVSHPTVFFFFWWFHPGVMRTNGMTTCTTSHTQRRRRILRDVETQVDDFFLFLSTIHSYTPQAQDDPGVEPPCLILRAPCFFPFTLAAACLPFVAKMRALRCCFRSNSKDRGCDTQERMDDFVMRCNFFFCRMLSSGCLLCCCWWDPSQAQSPQLPGTPTTTGSLD